MKQSETQAAVNSSKKLKSTRKSTESKDYSAAAIILISDKLSRTGIEIAEVGLFCPQQHAWFGTPYRPGPRFKFVTHRVGDEALVQREALLRKVLSCQADTGEAQRNAGAPKMFRKQKINIQFVLQCPCH